MAPVLPARQEAGLADCRCRQDPTLRLKIVVPVRAGTEKHVVWQVRARVAGGQGYEVQYEAKKTGKSAPAVKKAVKKVGNARKRVEKRLGR